MVSYEIDIGRLELAEVYCSASFVAVAVLLEVPDKVVVGIVPVVVVVMFRLGLKASSDFSDLRSLDSDLAVVLISIVALTSVIVLP